MQSAQSKSNGEYLDLEPKRVIGSGSFGKYLMFDGVMVVKQDFFSEFLTFLV